MDVFLDLRDAGKVGSRISEKDVLSSLEKPGLLVIDEFQERGGSEWESRVMTNLIDKRYASNRPTIIIANYSIEDMRAGLPDSIKSRMRENGKAFTFDWESFRKPKP
jgi:DNA replication protein DnaC